MYRTKAEQFYEDFYYLIAEEMSVSDARKVLGMPDDATQDEVEKYFKKAALANHPDRGGSTDAMQKINAAHSVLKKSPWTSSSKGFDWDAAHKKEYNEVMAMGKQMKSYIEGHTQTYLKYFKEFFPEISKYELKVIEPSEDRFASYGVYYKMIFKWYAEDRTSYIELYVSLSRQTSKGLSHGDNTDFTVSTDLLVYSKGKKTKMALRDWKSSNVKDMENPEHLFPRAKLKKAANPTTKYSKKDFIAGLVAEFQAFNVGKGIDDIFIPVGKDGEELFIKLFRLTPMSRVGGFASWHTAGLWYKKNQYTYSRKGFIEVSGSEANGSVPETLEGFNHLRNYVNAVKKGNYSIKESVGKSSEFLMKYSCLLESSSSAKQSAEKFAKQDLNTAKKKGKATLIDTKEGAVEIRFDSDKFDFIEVKSGNLLKSNLSYQDSIKFLVEDIYIIEEV